MVLEIVGGPSQPKSSRRKRLEGRVRGRGHCCGVEALLAFVLPGQACPQSYTVTEFILKRSLCSMDNRSQNSAGRLQRSSQEHTRHLGPLTAEVSPDRCFASWVLRAEKSLEPEQIRIPCLGLTVYRASAGLYWLQVRPLPGAAGCPVAKQACLGVWCHWGGGLCTSLCL